MEKLLVTIYHLVSPIHTRAKCKMTICGFVGSYVPVSDFLRVTAHHENSSRMHPNTTFHCVLYVLYYLIKVNPVDELLRCY